MITTLAFVEAFGASLGFIWISNRYARTCTRLKAATWRADTLQALEDRRIARIKGDRKRDAGGRFAA